MTFARFVLLFCTFFLTVGIAEAKTSCVFKIDNLKHTMTLTNDCTTDTAIQVPAGFTLNGNSHLITAVEPPIGWFSGPVITNAALISTINVTNLIIDMPNLQPNCAQVQGIYLNQASGTISGNTILHIGESGYCPDTGIGISVFASLLDTNSYTVTILRNRVLLASAYALSISGPIDATVSGNEFSINALGAHVVEFGARSGSFTGNTLETDSNGRYGQIGLEVNNNLSNIKIASNNFNLIGGTAGIGIDITGANIPVTVIGNRIFSYGSGITGITNGTSGSTVAKNEIRCYSVPIAGPAGTGNLVLPCPF